MRKFPASLAKSGDMSYRLQLLSYLNRLFRFSRYEMTFHRAIMA